DKIPMYIWLQTQNLNVRRLVACLEQQLRAHRAAIAPVAAGAQCPPIPFDWGPRPIDPLRELRANRLHRTAFFRLYRVGAPFGNRIHVLLIAAFARKADRVRPHGCASCCACLRSHRDDCGLLSGQRAVAVTQSYVYAYAHPDADADPKPIAVANPDTNSESNPGPNPNPDTEARSDRDHDQFRHFVGYRGAQPRQQFP